MIMSRQTIKQKGIIFGLDARIAVAIIAILSIVSGAEVYGYIQQTKLKLLQNNLEEFAKAVEQFSIDTGEDMRMVSSTESYAIDLIKDPGVINGWSGPYIKAEESGGDNNIYMSNSNYYVYRCNDTFGNQFNSIGCPVCTTQDNCHYWVKTVNGGFDMANVAKLDEFIDGSDGYDSGRFRVQWAEATSSDDLRAFYYIKPVISYP